MEDWMDLRLLRCKDSIDIVHNLERGFRQVLLLSITCVWRNMIATLRTRKFALLLPENWCVFWYWKLCPKTPFWREISINGYAIMLTLHRKELKKCLLWQSLIYGGRWNHSVENGGNLLSLDVSKGILYIVCFAIAAKSYTLWNWKFCHGTPW